MIINDNNFGLVSISNYAASGSKTTSADGEPLPVSSINSIIGSLRRNAIVATELDNSDMQGLVAADHLCLENTKRDLNAALADSLSIKPSTKYFDKDLREITTRTDIQKFIAEHLGNDARLVSFELSNGWLEKGGRTTIRLPKPLSKAHVSKEAAQLGEFLPFVDNPVGRLSFQFAGLEEKPSLVSSAYFRNRDDTHICSIVHLTCNVYRHVPSFMSYIFHDNGNLTVEACAEPGTNPAFSAPGLMTVRFTGGKDPKITNLSDLLHQSYEDEEQGAEYQITGGDYPTDRTSQMVLQKSSPEFRVSSSLAFAHVFMTG